MTKRCLFLGPGNVCTAMLRPNDTCVLQDLRATGCTLYKPVVWRSGPRDRSRERPRDRVAERAAQKEKLAATPFDSLFKDTK